MTCLPSLVNPHLLALAPAGASNIYFQEVLFEGILETAFIHNFLGKTQHCFNQWRPQKIFMGGFIQWHTVVIYIWCALFVTSQFVVAFMFTNQRFGEVC